MRTLGQSARPAAPEEKDGWSQTDEQLVPASPWFWGAWFGFAAVMLAAAVVVSLFARA